MRLNPQLRAVVDGLPLDTPIDIVFATVLLVCAETGLSLALSLSQARAATSRHRQNRATAETARPVYQPRAIEVAAEASIQRRENKDT